MQPLRAFWWSALAREVAMSTGSDEEFDGFMRGRWPAMVRLGYALTGDAGHAEDLAQAAFARAYASWGRVRRAGVVLRYWLDLSEAETAAALNCSVGTVKSQASRALAALRKNAMVRGEARDGD